MTETLAPVLLFLVYLLMLSFLWISFDLMDCCPGGGEGL